MVFVECNPDGTPKLPSPPTVGGDAAAERSRNGPRPLPTHIGLAFNLVSQLTQLLHQPQPISLDGTQTPRPAIPAEIEPGMQSLYLQALRTVECYLIREEQTTQVTGDR